MNLTLILLIDAPNLTCPALECGVGAPVALQLHSASVAKSRDGSGWLVGTISSLGRYCNEKWKYVFAIPDTEVSDEVKQSLVDLAASDVLGVCCLECGDRLLLDKLAVREVTNFTSESFRLFGDEDTIEIGAFRLLRRHSTILIRAIEASVEQHVAGYPHAAEPQPIHLSFLASPAHQTGPLMDLFPAEENVLVIDPAGATPLAGRIQFVPPLEIVGGRAFAVNVEAPDPDQHLGLDVHVDYQVVEPET